MGDGKPAATQPKTAAEVRANLELVLGENRVAGLLAQPRAAAGGPDLLARCWMQGRASLPEGAPVEAVRWSAAVRFVRAAGSRPNAADKEAFAAWLAGRPPQPAEKKTEAKPKGKRAKGKPEAKG